MDVQSRTGKGLTEMQYGEGMMKKKGVGEPDLRHLR